MKNMKSLLSLLCIIFTLLSVNALKSENYAMVISLRSGNQELSDMNKIYCITLKNIFRQAAVKPENIKIFFEGGADELPGAEKPEKEKILKFCETLRKKTGKDDKLWIFFFGHASASEKNVYLATQGKRLKGREIADSLSTLKAQKLIFCLNTEAYALYSAFRASGENALFSATNSRTQMNPPIFPRFLLSYWQASADSNLVEVFTKASSLTEKYYEESNKAIPEESVFYDGKKEYKPPFKNSETSPLAKLSLATEKTIELMAETAEDENSTASAPAGRKESDTKNLDFNEFDELIKTGEESAALPEIHPASEKTLNAIKEAAANAEKMKEYQAFFLKRTVNYTVNNDWSTVTERKISLYINDDTAAENYANLTYFDSPPYNEIEINDAEIIYKDGTFRKIKDRIITGSSRRTHILKFPGAAKGCLISLKLKNTSAPSTSLRNFNKEILFQMPVPVLNFRLILRFPKKQFFNYKLYNIECTPEKKENEYSRIYTFSMKNIQPLISLPYDPPLKNIAERIAISSMKSWNDFRDWISRMIKGSSKLDSKTEKLIEQLTRNGKTDTEKVRAIYEFLCELRYETTPIGARAFKPRTPSEVCFEKYGDCKDKANALVAMAGYLGIKGYFVLLNRMSFTDPDFPSWQFNHAIAYFPNLTGYPNGLWCDATDGSTPFGSVPPGDIGRNAFVIKENSGFEFKKVTLPFNATNFLDEKLVVYPPENNKTKAEFEITASGLNDYYLRQNLKRRSNLEQIYTIQSVLNNSFTGISVKSVETTPVHDLQTPLKITAECTIDDYELLLNSDFNPPKELWSIVAPEKRSHPLMLNDNQPFSISQTIILKGKKPLKKTEKISCIPYCNAEVKYDSFEKSYRRILKLNVDRPMIEVRDYKKFRNAVIKVYKSIRDK
jgi:hypothetical protein